MEKFREEQLIILARHFADQIDSIAQKDKTYRFLFGKRDQLERVISGCWNPTVKECDCPACGGYND